LALRGLCRLASKGSLWSASSHPDHEDVLFQAARPVILNVLEDVVARSGPAETHAMQEISGEVVVASDNAPEILEPAV
jgi:hypothetical protein